MSKMPLDMSKFKKIKSDGKTSTFQHKDGHQLTIAHGKLSPKLKEQLDRLPMAEGGEAPKPAPSPVKSWNQKDKEDFTKGATEMDPVIGKAWDAAKSYVGMAEGGGAFPLPNNGMTNEAAIAENPGPVADVGENPNAPAESQDPEEAPTLATPQQVAAPAEQAPVASDPSVLQMPQMGAQQVQQKAPSLESAPLSFDSEKSRVLNELGTENNAHEQDLFMGHIKPETYSDLFDKKSTLGKIGSIFGLLVSGAGAGLTHQPNALLQMMDKEIERDLDAQKSSAANAQNFVRLNQHNQMNQSTIANLGVETQAKSYALAQAQMLQTSYHKLVSDTDKMPEGPLKEAAKQKLGLVYAGVKEKINDINDQASGAAAYYNTLFGNKNPVDDEQKFQQQTAGMRMLGPVGEARAKDLEDKHFPGLSGQASVPLSGSDREAINSGMDFDQKLHRFMDWTKNHSGDLSPADVNKGQALAAELQGAYRQATHGGVYKEGEQNFISKLIDQDPTKFFNNIRVMPQLQAIAGENQARVNQLVKSKGFQGYAGSKPAPAQTPNPVQTGTYNGRPVVMQNGKWVYR